MSGDLQRVSSNISDAIIAYCRERVGQTFHAHDLRLRVLKDAGMVAPASADRVLRDLRRKGRVGYALLSRSKSLYQCIWVAPEAA